jgi:uncharacterized protein DUF1587
MRSSRAFDSAVVVGSLVAAAAFAACGRVAVFEAAEGDGGSSEGSRPPAGDSGGGDSGGGDSGGGDSAGSRRPGGDSSVASGMVLPNGLPPAVGAKPETQSSGTMVMRRLTNTEYDNIVSHLVGDTTQPAASFTIDPITLSGYDAPNSVAEQNVLSYYEASLPLVQTAIANPTAAGDQLVIPATTGVAGATQFINSFGLLAYRRPVAAESLTRTSPS